MLTHTNMNLQHLAPFPVLLPSPKRSGTLLLLPLHEALMHTIQVPVLVVVAECSYLIRAPKEWTSEGDGTDGVAQPAHHLDVCNSVIRLCQFDHVLI